MFKKLLILVTLFLGIGAMSCTLSRTGLVALCVSGLILAVYLIYCKGLNVSLSKILLWALIVSPILIIYVLSILPRLDTSYIDQSAEYRMIYNQIAIEMVYKHPFLGIGVNSFFENAPLYSSYRLASMELYGVHNVYLAFASQLGIPSVLILLWILFEVIILVRKNMLIQDPYIKVYTGGIFSAVTAYYLITNNLEMGLYMVPTWQYLWLLIGMLLALAKIGDKNYGSPVKIISV